MLSPVIIKGRLVADIPDVHEARKHAAESLRKLPRACRSLFGSEQTWKVEYSAELEALVAKVRRENHK